MIDKTLYFIQGSIKRADKAFWHARNNQGLENSLFVASGASLMNNVEISNSEAMTIFKHLRSNGVDGESIQVVPQGIERIGNFHYSKKVLDNLSRNFNLENLYLPIQELQLENYTFLINEITRTGKENKFKPLLINQDSSPIMRLKENFIQYAINEDIKNGLVSLNDSKSVENYVKMVENVSGGFKSFLSVFPQLFPKCEGLAYEAVSCGYKTFFK